MERMPPMPDAKEMKRPRRRQPSRWLGPLALRLVVPTLVAVTYGIVFHSEDGPELRTECIIDGRGSGHCDFTNTNWLPVADCAWVAIRDKKTTSVHTDHMLCSGLVWPRETKQVPFTMESPFTYCKSTSKVVDEVDIPDWDWSKVCYLSVADGP